MTSYDPDTLIQDKNITRDIYRRFGGKLALNCFVIEGGDITVGDEVQLVRGRASWSSTSAPPGSLILFTKGASHGASTAATRQ